MASSPGMGGTLAWRYRIYKTNKGQRHLWNDFPNEEKNLTSGQTKQRQKTTEAARYLPQNFPEVFKTGVFPEVFRKRERKSPPRKQEKEIRETRETGNNFPQVFTPDFS